MEESKWSYQKIYVENLPPDTTTEDITNYFSGYGTVTGARIKKKYFSDKLQVYGFVIFEEPRAARQALRDSMHLIKDQLVKIKRGHQRIYVLSYADEITTKQIYQCFAAIGKIINVKTHYLFVDGIMRRGSVFKFVSDDCVHKLSPLYNINGATVKVKITELEDDSIWSDLNSPNFMQ